MQARFSPFGLIFCAATLLFAQAPPQQEAQEKAKATTVVNQSPSDLIVTFPELSKLNFASSQEDLQGLMGKVSDWVQALFRDFPNTASVEQVHLEMLNVRGNVVRATNRKYLYLFSPAMEKEPLESKNTKPIAKTP